MGRMRDRREGVRQAGGRSCQNRQNYQAIFGTLWYYTMTHRSMATTIPVMPKLPSGYLLYETPIQLSKLKCINTLDKKCTGIFRFSHTYIIMRIDLVSRRRRPSHLARPSTRPHDPGSCPHEDHGRQKPWTDRFQALTEREREERGFYSWQ